MRNATTMLVQKKTLTNGVLGGVIVIGSLAYWAGHARAGGVPTSNPMHYAGSISEQGVPVNGTRAFSILVWNDSSATAAANLLCTTTTAATSVVQGRFEVPLDDSCNAPIQSTPNTWVEVQVAGVSYGRQQIGAAPYAMISGAVNGAVRSDAILPNLVTSGSLDAGAAGASIYNDGTSDKALVITGNTVADATGVAHAVMLRDNVTVGGSLATNGDITVGGAGRVGLGLYTQQVTNTATVLCKNAGDVALTGGASCSSIFAVSATPFLAQSHPYYASATASPTGWTASCLNGGANTGAAPFETWVTCMTHAE